MTTFSILDVEIQEIEGGKTLFRDSLTTFPIAMVILDPYTLESSLILDTALSLIHISEPTRPY